TAAGKIDLVGRGRPCGILVHTASRTSPMAVCPICQHDSRNPAHCELCDAALSPDDALPECLALPDGDLALSPFPRPWPIAFARPHLIRHDGRLLRVHALERGWYRDLRPVLAERAALHLPVLPPIHFVPCGEGALVFAEARVGQ